MDFMDVVDLDVRYPGQSHTKLLSKMLQSPQCDSLTETTKHRPSRYKTIARERRAHKEHTRKPSQPNSLKPDQQQLLPKTEHLSLRRSSAHNLSRKDSHSPSHPSLRPIESPNGRINSRPGIPNFTKPGGISDSLKPTLSESSKLTLTHSPNPTSPTPPKPTSSHSPKLTIPNSPKPTSSSSPKPTSSSSPKLTLPNSPKPIPAKPSRPTSLNSPKLTSSSLPKPTTSSSSPKLTLSNNSPKVVLPTSLKTDPHSKVATFPPTNQDPCLTSPEYQTSTSPEDPTFDTTKDDEPFVMSPLPLKPLTTVGDYTIKRDIGHGTYGTVKLAEHKVTKQLVAIKVITKASIKNSRAMARVEQELRLLSLLDHPHIVKVYDVVEDDDHFMIVMEHLTGGELFQYIVKKGRINEREARYFFRQIISALDYCHQNAIVHRDLKPENVLLDANMQIRLIDFGFANFYRTDATLSTFCGSPYYASPEMIRSMEYTGPEVDIWSLGVTLFTMLSGRLPFNSFDLKSFQRKVVRGEYELPIYFSKNVGSLIGGMLHRDRRKRISMAQIRVHVWTNTGYSDLPNSHLPIRPPVIRSPNPEILKKLVSYGYDEEFARTALLTNNKTLDPVVCLYLLIDSVKQKELRRKKASLLIPLDTAPKASPTAHYLEPTPAQDLEAGAEKSRCYSIDDFLEEGDSEDDVPLTQTYIKAAGRSFDSVSRRCSVQSKIGLMKPTRLQNSPQFNREPAIPSSLGPSLLVKEPKDGWFFGLFNVSINSNKPRLQIEQELQRVLHNLAIAYHVTESRFVCHLSTPKLAFEVRIIEKDPRPTHVIQFKNLKGSSWVHKKYCDKIINRMII